MAHAARKRTRLQEYISTGGEYFNALNDENVLEDDPANHATSTLPKSKFIPRFVREAEMWRNGTGWRNIDNLIGASLNNYNVEAIKRDTLEGKRVKALLHSARRKGGEKVADMEREAKAMIDRMAANFNPLSVIKLMGYVMSNVFHRLYQAVFLNEKVSLPSSPSPPPPTPRHVKERPFFVPLWMEPLFIFRIHSDPS